MLENDEARLERPSVVKSDSSPCSVDSTIFPLC